MYSLYKFVIIMNMHIFKKINLWKYTNKKWAHVFELNYSE